MCSVYMVVCSKLSGNNDSCFRKLLSTTVLKAILCLKLAFEIDARGFGAS